VPRKWTRKTLDTRVEEVFLFLAKEKRTAHRERKGVSSYYFRGKSRGREEAFEEVMTVFVEKLLK